MAAVLKRRVRKGTKRSRGREIGVIVALGTLVGAVGVNLYLRERRLEAKRRYQQEQFLRDLHEESMEGMNDVERREYQRRIAELEREYELRAEH